MIIVGKSLPSNTGDEIELPEFRRLYESTGYFAYAWTFNPKEWAVDALTANLPVWLYLIHKDRPWWSRLRMLIRDFRHSPDKALPCPQEWRQYALQQSYVNTGCFNWQNTSKLKPIHLWFLVNRIEDPDLPVCLHNFSPFFAGRSQPPYYHEYTENSFAFLRGPQNC